MGNFCSIVETSRTWNNVDFIKIFYMNTCLKKNMDEGLLKWSGHVGHTLHMAHDRLLKNVCGSLAGGMR